MRTHILPHRPRCRSECVKVLFDRGSVRTSYLLGAAATQLWTLDYVYYGHGFCELTGRNRKPVPGVVTSRYRAVSQEDRTANRFLKSQMRSALKTLVLRRPSNSTVAHLTAQGIVFDTQAKRSGIVIIISSVIIEQWLTINTSQKGVKICSKDGITYIRRQDGHINCGYEVINLSTTSSRPSKSIRKLPTQTSPRKLAPARCFDISISPFSHCTRCHPTRVQAIFVARPMGPSLHRHLRYRRASSHQHRQRTLQ